MRGADLDALRPMRRAQHVPPGEAALGEDGLALHPVAVASTGTRSPARGEASSCSGRAARDRLRLLEGADGLEEVGRQLAAIEHHPLVALDRLAGRGAHEGLARRQGIVAKDPAHFPEVGLDRAVARVEEPRQLAEVRVLLA